MTLSVLYSKIGATGAVFDIVATRDADITEATEQMRGQVQGPGGMRLWDATRAGKLLEKAQNGINALVAAGSAGIRTNPAFVFTGPDLGTVNIEWAD